MNQHLPRRDLGRDHFPRLGVIVEMGSGHAVVREFNVRKNHVAVLLRRAAYEARRE